MDEGEKLAALPGLKEEGNALYKDKKIAEAAKVYAKAIGILEQLQLRYSHNFNWHFHAALKKNLLVCLKYHNWWAVFT